MVRTRAYVTRTYEFVDIRPLAPPPPARPGRTTPKDRGMGRPFLFNDVASLETRVFFYLRQMHLQIIVCGKMFSVFSFYFWWLFLNGLLGDKLGTWYLFFVRAYKKHQNTI